ncbi:NAD-dependent epimerase/dehydratase family protein [Actinomycetospora callitridis]|uniref:NAD-dependent epimerase/dehydratase family protein n=1 Tax=Actinomycetospora callitridis TaxID=913944 RepID=UPI002365D0FE|nr:NAD-dependent epimerase/dehydratase family protein [Actinomycetospora callitridis]MDD7918887.1 NAD-dependent epimerase/dehydratase family protein [Actinomycetospora callitridis]
MRVAVTGANGFVGRAVVSALVGAGRDVVAVTRSGTVAGVDTRTAALDRPDEVAAALADVDAVCHLAAVVRVRGSLADPLGTWRTNLGGTLAVLGALRPGARFVHASTAAIGDDHRPPPHPYGAAKLAADLAARDATVGGTVGAISLRVANAAGPGDADRTRLVPAILAAADGAGEFVVNGDGSAVRDLVHVADVADAVVAALDAAEPGSYRAIPIGSGQPVSVNAILAAAGRVLGRPVPVRHREAAAEPAAVTVDPTRAREVLGWAPRRSGLDRIVRDAWEAPGGRPRVPL